MLAGCTFIEDLYSGTQGHERARAVPLEARPVEEPIARNYFVLESPQQSVVGSPQIVYTSEENTLSDLAREYGLGYDEIIAANPDIDPWLPGDKKPILLPTQYVIPDVPREGIVLNIASKRLFYFPKVAEGESQTVMTYPIGIGRVGWETPLGATEVVSKATDPHWFVPASVRREHVELGNPLPSVVPPGPDNPLGAYVLKLEMPGYLIHGTNQPYGVGMRVSHGCVRLYPENIELLFSLVEVGEPVRIINEPYLLGRRNGELYFEAHQPLEDDAILPVRSSRRIALTVRVGFEPESARRWSIFDRLRAMQTALPCWSAITTPTKCWRARDWYAIPSSRIQDAPTLSEVREMMDEVMAEELVDEPVEEKDL